MLEAFVIRLLIAIGLIWLTQFLTTEIFKLEAQPRRWILIVVAVLAVLFLAFGEKYFNLGL